MKVLFWQWNAFMQKGIENAFKRMSIEYEVLYHQPKDWEQDEEFANKIRQGIKNAGTDVVFSVNYAPVVSDECQAAGVRYVAWIYDSPIHIRNISSFVNSCNRLYFFDRGQVERYWKQGYENVNHMTLAADENVWTQAFGQNNVPEKYSCDVAFVGQLYESDYGYLCGPLSQYYRGRMEGIICAQSQLYGAYLLDELIDDKLMNELNKFYRQATDGKFSVERREMEYACAREITGRERRMALSLLANRYKVNLYSGDKCGIENIKAAGYVDYYSQMPLAFAGGKINLNISLKIIKTGIPLRVLDVLSCGGFLITNYQEEIMEYFVQGEDLVVYEDMKDLVLKVDYYLKNESERMRIAANGQRKVRELFGFDERLFRMLGGN